jgi:hypothetical protein
MSNMQEVLHAARNMKHVKPILIGEKYSLIKEENHLSIYDNETVKIIWSNNLKLPLFLKKSQAIKQFKLLENK